MVSFYRFRCGFFMPKCVAEADNSCQFDSGLVILMCPHFFERLWTGFLQDWRYRA
jgi:hypothetical protein